MSALTKDDISDMSKEQQEKYCYWCFYKDYGNCDECALVHLVTPPKVLPETPITTSNISSTVCQKSGRSVI